MISITKRQIEDLLTSYQDRINKSMIRSPVRNLTGGLPSIIKDLNKFIKNVPHDNPLTPEELYTLTILLLNRKIRTKKLSGAPKSSEALAQIIEEKFENRRMDCFRACGELNLLDQKVFNFICNLDNLEAIPKDISDLYSWLKENDLLPELEKAMAHLAQNNALSSGISKKDLSNLAQVSKYFHGLFSPALDRELAPKLGEFIIRADLKNAKKVIQANPRLLTIPMTVTDYAHRKIQGTALQLALGAEDVKFHDDEIAMVEMIMAELGKQPNGEYLIAQQICDQFPEGWETAHNERVKRDQAALDDFVAAIRDNNNEAAWEAAAETYRARIDYENLGKGVIETGLHCNTKLVVAWLVAYLKNYIHFGDRYDHPKNLTLWQKGGACERGLSAAYAMALARRSWNIIGMRQHLDRNLSFLLCFGSVFPLDSDPQFRLGYNYAVDVFSPAQSCKPQIALLTAMIFMALSDKKYQRCKDLRERATQTLKQNPHHLK